MAAKCSAVVLAGAIVLSPFAGRAFAKRRHRSQPVNSGNPSYQLYQLLNDSYGGKLKDFCILAGLYKSSKNPAQEYQRVLRVDYNKDNFFGRLEIHVRSVAKLTPVQLKTYPPRQIFKFAVSDSETFEKIHAGPFGEPGDLYLRASGGAPPAPAPITSRVRGQFADYIARYILPALQNKQ